MSKIVEVATMNEYSGYLNIETFEVFNDSEFKDLLLNYKENEIENVETLSLNELIETFKKGYPSFNVYEGSEKIHYFKCEVGSLSMNNSDTHYFLFNDIDEFKEYRSEAFLDFFSDNKGFIYNEVDELIGILKDEKNLIERVELESGTDIFLYYEKSGYSDYDLMNNVLRIDSDLTLNEFNQFIEQSK